MFKSSNMFGRSYRRPRFSRSRSYKAWPKRSSLIRRAVGNVKAAKRQNDISNTVISGSTRNYQIVVEAGDSCSYAIFNVWRSLESSPMFKTLRSCYDQVRMNSVKVKFSLLQAMSMSGSNCPIFGTVWDRNGLNKSQYVPNLISGQPLPVNEGSRLNWTWDMFASYSSFEKRSMSSGSAFNATLTIYPSSIQEKGQFVACADVLPNTDLGMHSEQITSPLSNPSVPFKPQIVTGIYCALNEADQSFIFSVDWEIDVTFRGMHASVTQDITNIPMDLTYVRAGSTITSDMTGAVNVYESSSACAHNATIACPNNSTLLLMKFNAAGIYTVEAYCNQSGAATNYNVNAGLTTRCGYIQYATSVPKAFMFGKETGVGLPVFMSLMDSDATDTSATTIQFHKDAFTLRFKNVLD